MSKVDFKQLREKSKLLFITHDGSFHYDEILATAFLGLLYDYEVVRTRDNQVIETGDIVYDVGFVCDPSKCRFDHHMKTFTETYDEKYQYKLSSAGLIYKYFHEEILSQVFKFSEETVEKTIYDHIIEKIYRNIFLPADAIDNGYEQGGEFFVRSIQTVIGGFNKQDADEETQMSRFIEALEFVKIDIMNYFDWLLTSYLPGLKIAKKVLESSKDRIAIFEESVTRSSVLEAEKLLGMDDFLFMIIRKDSGWRIVCFNKEGCAFENRMSLHEDWRGKRGEELQKTSGIETIDFVHATGFTGGVGTLEDAIKMCKFTIDHNEKVNKQ